MRVAVFTSDYAPIRGGSYTYESDIIKALSELAHESRHTFVIFTSNVKVKKTLESNQVLFEYQYIPKTTVFLNRILRIVRRVVYYLTPEKHHRIRLNLIDRLLISNNIHIAWFPTPFAYEIDLPYIFTLWDLQHRLQPFFPEVKDGYLWKNREAYYSLMLRRASVIIVGTRTGQEEIERFYQVPSGRINVLPFPTPSYVFDFKSSKDLDIHERYDIPKKYLFYPAQFWPHKNHANLLLALKIVKEKYELALSLALAGSDKGNVAYVRKLVDEMDLSSQVFFLGFVSTEELIALYKNAFALTFMSFFGPDNLPPLEAFALGTPVIASDVSGAKEQLGDAALLVDPKNPEQIAATIYALYNNPQMREKLIEKGLNRAGKWDSHDFVREVFSIIDDFEPIRRCWE